MTDVRTGALALVDDPAVSVRDDVDASPELGSVGDRLYADMAPLAWCDDDYGWALAYLCGAVGVMYQEVDDLVRDAPGVPGWAAVLDVNLCRDDWLPWLGQFVGVVTVAGSTPDEMRAALMALVGFRRGSVGAIRAAAQTTLTGSQTVIVAERYTGDAYKLAVRTVTAQTPDAAATLAAILTQKPAGLVLDYATVAGQTYDAVRVAYATYAVVRSTFLNYGRLAAGTP
jgi:hypothetical protein